MDLRRTEVDGLARLGNVWKTTPGAEFEAMLTGADLTTWQDVIQYLRSLGMRENPQLVKLNICLSNDIRITLEGAGVIQAYCRDNRLTGKPFVAMLKENITDAEPVDINTYGARAKLKREIPLAADDERVKDVLARWDSLGKHFRNIQRFEFMAPGGLPLRFDISLVRENLGRPARTFQEARVTSAPPRYEVEVELLANRDATAADAAYKMLVRGLSWLLQGRQRSFVLVSETVSERVRGEFMRLFWADRGGGGGNRGRSRNGNNRGADFRYPGPQPATLERRNMSKEPEPGTPNLRTMPGGYNVTDKADGLRCALFVAADGLIFLLDSGGRVYATGRRAPTALAGLVLDGEWIRRDRKGAIVSAFYAFDILAARGGDTSITEAPFTVAGLPVGAKPLEGTRLTVMSAAVAELTKAEMAVRGVPANQMLQINVKTFRIAGEGDAIFRDAAAGMLADAKTASYNTDGLIFSPNSAPMPLGRGTWAEQLKWKPAAENTIDFLVIADVERGKDGRPISMAETVGTKYREDTGQTVRYKTLRLFVGGTRNPALADPRATVLGDGPLPSGPEEGEWREQEFRPTDPRDPMAAVCYVAIGAGLGDPAGAAPAAQALDTDTNVIRALNGDVIQSNMIVEMAYRPENAPGWRWVPNRVRHDKTERWMSGTKRGTMNADWVANLIWGSIHNPVTEAAVTTGIVDYCPAPRSLAAPGVGARTPARDLMKVQCLRNFHENFVKPMLLKRTAAGGAGLCDLAMGNAVDLNRWLAAGAGYVLGCDVTAANVNDPTDGAYRRLLNKMVELGGRDRVPPMLFAQADAARRLTTGEAGLTVEDGAALARAFGAGGPAAAGFEVVTATAGIQSLFRDENTLAGFLVNLADTVKVGGYFLGYGFDGDAVARLLGSETVAVGRDGAIQAWSITKRYGSAVGSSVPPSAAGLGLAVDVDFVSGGWTRTEYLVSWPYLQSRLTECGLEVVSADEARELGLPGASQMFSETWALADAAGETYAMTDAMRQFSFLNRWWVFRRRVDRRPAPPASAVVAATGAVEEVMPEGAAVAGADVVPLAALEAGAAAVAAAGGGGGAAEAPSAAAVPENLDFLVRWESAEPDMRLGEALSDWPRYMTTGTLVELMDEYELEKPEAARTRYPSVEAAVAAARYTVATTPAEKGAQIGRQIFSSTGALHQRFEQIRAAAPDATTMAKAVWDQVQATRILVGKAKMKAYKLEYDQALWDERKEDVYRRYLGQRYLRDERFRAMIDAIKAKGGQILYANTADYNEMGVGVRIDGSIVGGENKIGKWMMELA